jgi:glycosyltransferase involved in cell wall biosynthesis
VLIVAYSRLQLEQWTASLRQFVAGPHFNNANRPMNGASYTRISIVMPAYNQGQFIERSILSVLNQDYPNLQFIIMDGGSTDGTVDVIRKYETRLMWRTERDHGQSDAINKALSLADGEIVGWLNSDDVYFPGALYRMHQIAKQWPHAVLYSGTVAIIDRDDRVLRVAKFIRPSTLRLLHEGLAMSSQGVFWRRGAQPADRSFNLRLHHAMDVEFWLKVLAKGHAEFVPELIGGFRVYEGTKTSATGERGLAEMSAIRKEYGIDDQTIRWKLMRAVLRLSRLVQWAVVTRTRCTTVIAEGQDVHVPEHSGASGRRRQQ